MISENDFQETGHVFSLTVSAEPDPGILVRVLTYFQILNVVPGNVVAEVRSEEMQRIRIETDGLTAKQVSLIAAKIDQLPSVEAVHWCRL